MTKRYVSNDTPNVMFCAGVMILPGEGREVESDETDQAATQAAEPATEPDPDANFRALLEQPLKDILPLLEEASDETLASLARLEQAADTPRKGLLGPITEEKLKRAQAKTGAPT
jgi:hypothetical protein